MLFDSDGSLDVVPEADPGTGMATLDSVNRLDHARVWVVRPGLAHMGHREAAQRRRKA
jgi:hypothetical protein